jgi:hydrogenase nickel incorporation protein HypA/HybF
MRLPCGLHEMSIAESVLDALRAEAGLRPGTRVTRAGLRIGELSGVETESLQFCLEAVAPEIAFIFELAPWTRRCRHCSEIFRVMDARPACARCGSADTEKAGGDEIDLMFVELEEP